MRIGLAISVIAAACGEPTARVGDGPPSPSTQTALVAARDLPAGTPIREGDLQARIMPLNYLPPHAFRAPESLLGRVLRFRVLAQEPITDPALVPEALALGERAVPVPLGDARVAPGEHVDVWWRPPEAGAPCAAFQALSVVGVADDRARLAVPVADMVDLAVLAQSPTVRVTVRSSDDHDVNPEIACSR